MRYKAVFYLLGRLLFMISGVMLLPAAVSYYFHEIEVFRNFLISSFAALAIGAIPVIRFHKRRDEGIGLRDGFLLVTLSWLIISLFGSLPYYFSPYFNSFIDAFFEAASGFTTTGASVLKDIEALPHGLLFWRDFTQWLGGMGIIVLAVAILPQLSVGGMQLMKNETPGPTFEQLKPRIKQTALTLWKVYVLFSVAQVLLLWLFGMNLFESFCHMFGTMGAGGFSTRNASIAAFDHNIQVIITIFMYLAGMNFVLHYSVLKGNVVKVFQDAEWKFYTVLCGTAILIITLNLELQAGYSFLDALRLSAFQVAALTTTTGFATDNFDAWPHLSRGILFLLMFVGGCAGSTAGGMKQIRLLLFFKRAYQSVMQHIFPKAVITVKVNKRVIPEGVLRAVSSFFLIYIVIFSFATLFLLCFNIDFITATSAVVACLSNIGPGLGLVGPLENFAFLPTVVKMVLIACMIIGRLEIYTVLVLFFPATWKR